MAAARRPCAHTFDAAAFDRDLRRLLVHHNLQAITAHVMAPVDAGRHHIFSAEAGVDQLHIDILNVGRRDLERRSKELA